MGPETQEEAQEAEILARLVEASGVYDPNAIKHEKSHVLIYGTLMRGEKNNFILRHSAYIRDVGLKGFEKTFKHGYPFARENISKTLACELWEISATTLMRLIYFEGPSYNLHTIQRGTFIFIDANPDEVPEDVEIGGEQR